MNEVLSVSLAVCLFVVQSHKYYLTNFHEIFNKMPHTSWSDIRLFLIHIFLHV